MTDIIVLAVVIVIVGCASAYIYKAKKSGARCVGCSHAGSCGRSGNECSCGTENK
ncbi:MAG: FeoB-associated Cys-rich membrane protein [Ruminococcaceae bacterium]|nr:FeoB-associated Cys-rich membrane protein [Oscillospiraceae bacterium]